jgi:hypothetical protein
MDGAAKVVKEAIFRTEPIGSSTASIVLPLSIQDHDPSIASTTAVAIADAGGASEGEESCCDEMHLFISNLT